MTRWLERISTPRQFGLGIAAVTTMVLISLAVEPWVGYQAVAFFLLVTVSVLALFYRVMAEMRSITSHFYHIKKPRIQKGFEQKSHQDTEILNYPRLKGEGL